MEYFTIKVSLLLDVMKWFKARFGRAPVNDLAYFLEWLDRFDTGELNALNHMDKQSKRVWEDLKEK